MTPSSICTCLSVLLLGGCSYFHPTSSLPAGSGGAATDYSEFKTLVSAYFLAMNWGEMAPSQFEYFDSAVSVVKSTSPRMETLLLDAIGHVHSVLEKKMAIRKRSPKPTRMAFTRTIVKLLSAVRLLHFATRPSAPPADAELYLADAEKLLTQAMTEDPKEGSSWERLHELEHNCLLDHNVASSPDSVPNCGAASVEILQAIQIAFAGRRRMSTADSETLEVWKELSHAVANQEIFERTDHNAELANVYRGYRSGFLEFLKGPDDFKSMAERDRSALDKIEAARQLMPFLRKADANTVASIKEAPVAPHRSSESETDDTDGDNHE